MGNFAITVHAANIHDTKPGIFPADKAVKQYPSIQRFCADAGYRGTFVREIEEKFHLGVDISEKIKPHKWEKLPWRWVVERTFGWGLIILAASAKTTKLQSPPQKRCSKSLICIRY